MESPRNLPETIECVLRLQGSINTLQGEIDELKQNQKRLETAHDRGLQVGRLPPPIPPFPKALEDIGLSPPSKRRTATA